MKSRLSCRSVYRSFDGSACALLAVIISFGLTTTVDAQFGQAKKRPTALTKMKPSKSEAAILAALDAEVTVSFDETPLTDVVAFIRDSNKINVAIDKVGLEDIGLSTDLPISITAKGITLRSFLALSLDQSELTWTIQDETLMVTTVEEADYNLVTRLYLVADLVEEGESLLYNGGNADYDSLIEVLTSTLAPESWEDVGGPGSIRGATMGDRRLLIVSQTYRNHESIAKLLDEIRAVEKTPGPAKPKLDATGYILRVYPLSADTLGQEEKLSAIIQKSIQPDTWKNEKADVDGAGGSLVITAQPKVHAEVTKLLEAMNVLAPRDYWNGGKGGGSFGSPPGGGLF